MVGDRSRYGLLVSALGAVILIVSVFLPWYEVAFTANGVAFVSQLGDQFVAQFGNSHLQSYLAPLHGSLAALSGQGIGAVSAHQVLHDMNIILIVLAILALLDALFPLALGASVVAGGAGGAAVLLGGVAAALRRLSNDLAADPRGGHRLAVAARGRLAGPARLDDDGSGRPVAPRRHLRRGA